eukprot:scaffold80170_cov43-Prasinocladus_malaysianus.AAC.2
MKAEKRQLVSTLLKQHNTRLTRKVSTLNSECFRPYDFKGMEGLVPGRQGQLHRQADLFGARTYKHGPFRNEGPAPLDPRLAHLVVDN